MECDELSPDLSVEELVLKRYNAPFDASEWPAERADLVLGLEMRGHRVGRTGVVRVCGARRGVGETQRDCSRSGDERKAPHVLFIAILVPMKVAA